MATLRERLKRGDVVIGGWMQISHPAVARILSLSGFDWIALDIEHGVVDMTDAMVVLNTIRDLGCTPLVRLAGNDYADTKRYLDAGAQGVIAPLVNSRESAQELVRAAKYPPQGERGVGYCVANDYGESLNDYLLRANKDTLCCVQIEHMRAIEHLDDILTVPGVDAAFVGPYDLSASIGTPGDFAHPEYLDALRRFRSACRKHKVAQGIHVVRPNPDEVIERAREGYQLIAYSLDVTLLAEAARRGLEAIRAKLGRSRRKP